MIVIIQIVCKFNLIGWQSGSENNALLEEEKRIGEVSNIIDRFNYSSKANKSSPAFLWAIFIPTRVKEIILFLFQPSEKPKRNNFLTLLASVFSVDFQVP